MVNFRRAAVLNLKSHPVLNERWLQDKIVEDPTLLGLGELVVKDRERMQPRAGRLDLLLQDSASDTRYEVELQLGATDEAHIIRTIEYWDIERSRYPTYDHVAVIVAENITARFLNVISLFNKAIPLIAIQMQALQIDDVVTLSATTVLDLSRVATEEEDEPSPPADRDYWMGRASAESLAVVDDVVALVGEVKAGYAANYTRGYVGLSHGGLPDNFVHMAPRRSGVVVSVKLAQSEDLTRRLEESGIDLMPYGRRGRYKMRLRSGDVAKHHDLLLELISLAVGAPEDAGDH